MGRRRGACSARMFGVAWIAWCALCAAGPARGGEGIERFEATVRIRPDGAVEVHEEITAVVAGDRIKSGIFRDLPLRQPDRAEAASYDIVSVAIDGEPLPSPEIIRSGETVRVMMGDRNKRLTRGEHVFALSYVASRQVKTFNGQDELNWNVTGDGWAFVIEEASCRVRLPDGTAVRQTAGWIGRRGGRESPAGIREPVPEEALFTAARPIRPGEHFTVAVGFAEPGRQGRGNAAPVGKSDGDSASAFTAQDAAQDARTASGYSFWAGIARFFRVEWVLLLSFVYYFVTWWIWGRDPEPGNITPIFHPPSLVPDECVGREAATEKWVLSAAAVEYVKDATRLSERGFSSLFLSLALRGLCRIGKNGYGTCTVTPLKQAGALPRATPEEKAVYARLVEAAGIGGELVVGGENGSLLRDMRKEVVYVLAERYAPLWSLNRTFSAVGWWLVLPLGLVLNGGTFAGIGTLPFLLMVVAILAFVVGPKLAALRPSSAKASRWGLLLTAGTAAVVLAVTGGLIVIGAVLLILVAALSDYLSWSTAVLVALPILFLPRMKAPSPEGRALLDAIDGLALYINAAGRDRAAMAGAPEETPASFERLLPYAMVLGLENAWSSHFAGQFAAGLIANANVGVDAWSEAGVASFLNEFDRGAAEAVRPPARSVFDNADGSSLSSDGDSAFSSDGGGAGSGGGGGGGGGF